MVLCKATVRALTLDSVLTEVIKFEMQKLSSSLQNGSCTEHSAN